MAKLTTHFNSSEFTCPCCGKFEINYNLLYLLEAIREHFRKPVYINSGYRCEKYNQKINGAKDSQHLYGNAADIVVSTINPLAVYTYVNNINPRGGIGRYSTYTHVDICMSPPNRRWNNYINN
jgi:uncharacterized protein YcbK (DUF882 family)